MLSARAYSFRQKSRLAISLSWVGGYTNIVALLTCGSLVSHATGSTTSLGQHLGEGEWALAMFFAFLILTFFIGAMLSALLTESARRRGNPSKYVWPMAVEAMLLTLFATASLLHGHVAPTEAGWRYMMSGLASLAMGLQNATITKISGSVVRTTHVTGVVTDLGLEGVQFAYWWLENVRGRWATRAGRLARVSQRHPTFLRLLLLASIFASYLLGATLGMVFFGLSPAISMAPPVVFLIAIILIDRFRPITDVRELDLLSDPELKTGEIVKALLPPELGLYRFACRHGDNHHRAPNFQLWVDRLPVHCRVVILAVSPLTRFDTNAVMDLEAALGRLHAEGRKLILGGVTQKLVRSLEALGVDHMMDVTNLCPDLEFAIARGMALVQAMKRSDRGAHGR